MTEAQKTIEGQGEPTGVAGRLLKAAQETARIRCSVFLFLKGLRSDATPDMDDPDIFRDFVLDAFAPPLLARLSALETELFSTAEALEYAGKPTLSATAAQ